MATNPNDFYEIEVAKLNELAQQFPSFTPNGLPNQIYRWDGKKPEWVTIPNEKDLEELTRLRERIEKLMELTNVQCSNGNWNWDPYMHGMANGMLLALAMMMDVDAEFLEAPKDGWGRMKMDKEIKCMEQDFSAGGGTKGEDSFSRYEMAMKALGLK